MVDEDNGDNGDNGDNEDGAFVREVLRVNLRFNTEVIEALHVCPFARAARLDGSSVRRVLTITAPDVDAVIGVIEALEREDSPEVAVGQIIFPRLQMGPKEYAEFISDVGRANAARYAPKRPVFVYAAFHPALAFSTETPPRLVPFFRRSPDPLMQVVRLSVLDAIHASRPSGSAFWDGSAESLALLMAPRPESVTDRITRENHAAALAGSLEKISAIHEELAEDRARSYPSERRGGLESPPSRTHPREPKRRRSLGAPRPSKMPHAFQRSSGRTR